MLNTAPIIYMFIFPHHENCHYWKMCGNIFIGLMATLLMFLLSLECQSHVKANLAAWHNMTNSQEIPPSSSYRFLVITTYFSISLPAKILKRSYFLSSHLLLNHMLYKFQPNRLLDTVFPKDSHDELSLNPLDTSQSSPPCQDLVEWTLLLS